MVRMLLTASLVRGMAAPLAAQDPPAVSDDVFRHIHEHMAWVFPTGSPDRFVTTDLANGLQALIDPRGFTLRDATDTAAWSTRLQITDLGRANGPHTPWTTAEPCAHQRRLSWTGTAMDVDYLNTGHGIRQNFLVFTPPAGTGNLMVRMRWESDLVPRPLDGSGVVFTDPGGAPVHAYADLYVFDACDQVLPAWMELDMDTRTLALVVDDRDAIYPITVDPISTSFNTEITLSHVGLAGVAGTEFGISVSSAGDLNGDGYGDIAIGASRVNMGQSNEGVVFVFYGGPNGITPANYTVLESNRAGAQFGISVAHGGDVNGDGFSDLVVGGNTYANGQGREGAVWVFFGSPTGVENLNFQRFESDRADSYLGFMVRGLGDINGDGYSDIAAGSRVYGNPEANESVIYIFMGSANGIDVPYNPVHILETNVSNTLIQSIGGGDINGDGYDDMVVSGYGYRKYSVPPAVADGVIFVFFGSPTNVAGVPRPFGTTPTAVNPSAAQIISPYLEVGNRRTGWCVAVAGDVNGDGYADVIVGDWTDTDNNQNNEGSFMIFHGSPTGLNEAPDFVMFSNIVGAAMGHSVASAGDVNGDGYADVLVGVANRYGSDQNIRPGAVELYFGGPNGITAPMMIRFTPAANQNNARMGDYLTVACAGDINGDGFSDMIFSIPKHSTDPISSSGDGSDPRVRIVHGGGLGLYYHTQAQTTPWRIDPFTEPDGHAGWSVANAGDVDGDGFSDVLVGIPDADGGQGHVHLYLGTPTGPGALPSAVLQGSMGGERFGACVATAGDVNGDGYADVAIGAPGGNGRVVIHLGGPGGLDLTPATVLTGAAGSGFGAAVSTAGDVNADGFADLIVGLPDAGAVHVYHGSPTGLETAPALIIPGPQSGSGFGTAVATAGDVNGDGFSDIIIGAPYYSNGHAGEGAAYVYQGSLDGIVATPAWQFEPNMDGIRFGISVAGLGDTNGDGYSDVAIGADQYSPNGRIYVFRGGPTGLAATAANTLNLNGMGEVARLGSSVAEAGDLDGNGLADLVAGAPNAFNGQVDEGRVVVWLFMPTGTPVAQTLESNVVGRQLGWCVAGGGDINGDGFSDLVVGAPYATGADGTATGMVYYYSGNGRAGLSRPARQYQADLVSPISTNSEDFLNPDYFGLGLHLRSHMQRKPGRMHWEVVHEGMPFSGTPIATSVSSQGQTAWSDLGLGGVEHKQLIYKVPGFRRHKWRVRAEYPLYRSGPDGQRFGKWHYGYASAHGDIGILPVELLDLNAVPLIPGNLVAWSTASEQGTSHFEVERSTDLVTFTTLGTVQAAGSSPMTIEYELLDTDAPQGTSYYRLRIVDLDGTMALSAPVAVHRHGQGQVLLYPNPTSGDQLYWEATTDTHIAEVRDALGRVVAHAHGRTSPVSAITLAGLAPGHYTLVLYDATGNVVARTPFIRR